MAGADSPDHFTLTLLCPERSIGIFRARGRSAPKRALLPFYPLPPWLIASELEQVSLFISGSVVVSASLLHSAARFRVFGLFDLGAVPHEDFIEVPVHCKIRRCKANIAQAQRLVDAERRIGRPQRWAAPLRSAAAAAGPGPSTIILNTEEVSIAHDLLGPSFRMAMNHPSEPGGARLLPPNLSQAP